MAEQAPQNQATDAAENAGQDSSVQIMEGRLTQNIGISILAISFMIGVVFRFRMYLQNRSLWLDPAALANNIVDKNYSALWGLLDVNQSAPIGFLLTTKFFGSISNYTEYGLIFLPFIFGVGSLFLFLFFTMDLLGKNFAAIAFIPFSFSSTAIYYSGEFKQYSSDLFFSVLILLIACRILKSNFNPKWILTFGITGFVSIWYSNPAIFMISGTGIALLINAIKKGQKRDTGILLITGSLILIHFCFLYFVQIRPSTPEKMFDCWKMGFAPVLPISVDTINWWYEMFIGYAKYPLGFNRYGIYFSCITLVLGLIFCFARKTTRDLANILIFPIIFLLIASIFEFYPITTGKYDIHSRLVLFTVPIAYIFIAIGIIEVSKKLPLSPAILILLSLFLVCTPIYKMTTWPRFIRQEMRPLISDLQINFVQEDSIYVFELAIPAFKYYTRNDPLPFIQGTTRDDEELLEEIAKLPTGKRIWVVISHDHHKKHEIIKSQLQSRNGPVTVKNYPDAMLFLSEPQNNL